MTFDQNLCRPKDHSVLYESGYPVLQISRSLRTQALAQSQCCSMFLFVSQISRSYWMQQAQTCLSPKCLIYWIVASYEEEIIVKWIGLPSSSLFFFFLGLPSSFSNSCAIVEDLGKTRYQQQLPVVEMSRFVNKGTQRDILSVKETVLNVWQHQRRRLDAGRKCTNYLWNHCDLFKLDQCVQATR